MKLFIDFFYSLFIKILYLEKASLRSIYIAV